MERREKARATRRVQVNFWKHGSDRRGVGYTANISVGGMYLTTNHIVPAGSRVRAELCSGDHSSMIEAEVVRVHRSPHKTLQGMHPSGMGLRFLGVEELVSELMPELATGRPRREQPPASPELYRLRFNSRQQLLQVYLRDLNTGGLFVPTDDPAPLDAVVTVEMSVAEAGAEPVRFQARVVHRLEPGMPHGAPGGNLMAGMGLELLDCERTLAAIRALAGPSS